MPEENDCITVSYLVTKEDFADYKVAAVKASIKRKDVLSFNITGFILVLIGLVGRVFFSWNFYTHVTYVLLVLVGFFLGIYFSSLHPYVTRRRAIGYFEANREKMIAQTVTFYKESVAFSTDRYTASIPYQTFFQVYEDGKVFILYTGIGEMRFVPKRAMSKDDCQLLHERLVQQMKEKYKQEGGPLNG